MNKIQERINKLTNLINNQNEIYFDKSSENEITDPLYDQLLKELRDLEEKYPEYKLKNSPTDNIGESIENTFNDVYHNIPMQSLAKVLNFDDFIVWIKKMIDNEVYDFNFQYKFDGLANELIYENSKLIQGSTRGNGIIGKDNTITAKLIPNVPLFLKDDFFKNKNIKIRGEIVLLKEGLKKINETLSDDAKYQNVRNAASGILKNKIPNKKFIKYLRFMPYNIYIDNKNSNELYSLDLDMILEIFNVKEYYLFNASFYDMEEKNVNFLKEYFDKWYNERNNLPFDIDGIVIKANKYNDWKKLGIGKKHPNYAMSYKFPAMEAISILEDVEWLLGGKGTITPRAKIKPVIIGGTTITNPTLHNVDIIKNLDLKVGDHIVVSRHGDVIPEIDKVIKELRIGDEKEIIPPTICPVCKKPLTIKGTFIRCDNIYCEGRKLSKIENFIRAMEIDNFGPALIEKLYNINKINNFTDIYNLTKEDISQLDKMGDKSAEKVINNINKSRNNTLDKIINGLMIPNVSIEKSKILMDKYETLNNFINCTYDELINLPTFGEIIVNNILNYLSSEIHIELLNNLIKLNIIGTKKEIIKGKLNEKSFCFTGKLSISRTEIEKIIIDNGGIVSSIKKGTDYLIIGDGAKEHKIEKAKSYNINVISEKEFYNLIKIGV